MTEPSVQVSGLKARKAKQANAIPNAKEPADERKPNHRVNLSMMAWTTLTVTALPVIL